MSEKISAMPSATQMNNADVLPIVQGGVNKKITRDVFLTANGTDDLAIVGASLDRIDLPHGGGIIVTADSGDTIELLNAINLAEISISPAGAITVASATGQEVVLDSNGSSFTLDGAGNFAADVVAGGTYLVHVQGVNVIDIDAAGQITITSTTGNAIILNSNGANLTVGAAGNMSLTVAGGQVLHVDYVPGTPGDWAGSPTSVWEALNRIANVVSGGGATPIP
jgi:hypothetical protein